MKKFFTLLVLSCFSYPLFISSAHAISPSPDSNARQQTNELSAYLDGSVIYGSDAARAAALRTMSNGMLKTSAGNLPPFNTMGLPNANDAHLVPDDQLFVAGDVRSNENVELSAVHALWIREHNQLAATIARLFPKLNDEQIYQWARHIVGAELQVITYKEFVPALIGSSAMRSYGGYRSTVNAGIANEFSTAAFRVGHTLINDDVEFLDNDGEEVRDEIELRDAFFNPATILEVGADPILKYLATDNAQEVDPKLVDGLRNFLFGPPGSGGFDLASRNIQRGRDHGIADYNKTRRAFGLRPISRFSEITRNTELQEKLRSLYGNVNNIDLWVGGLSEDHARGASVGPTFQRIIADQFDRLRSGDSYWYQRVFSGAALRILESTRLSDIIRRNSTIFNVQRNVFFFDEEMPPDRTPADPTADVERLVRSAALTLVHVRNFRTYDGSQNNRFHPNWGQAGGALRRIAPAAYADGVSQPAGQNRPSARLISNTVSAQSEEEAGEDAPRNNRNLADWIYAWGQFVDHDLDLTTTGATPFNIEVPTGDPFFDPNSTGTQIIPLNRSNPDT